MSNCPAPRLVLLPGLDGTGKLFAPLLRQLAADLHVEVVVLPSEQALGYEDLCTHVEARLPAETEFVLVAESFAGPLAIMLAARKPPRLRGIVLCATFSTLAGSWLRSALPIAPAVSPHAVPMPVLSWILMGRRATPELEHALRESLRCVRGAVLKARALAALHVDVTSEARSLSLPVLVIRPTRDRLLPSMVYERTISGLSNARTCHVDGPHFILQTNAAACALEIESFLRGI